jgi:polar amino acid transport system substrate-binding protein
MNTRTRPCPGPFFARSRMAAVAWGRTLVGGRRVRYDSASRRQWIDRMRLLCTALMLVFAPLLAARGQAPGVVTLRADLWCPYNCQPGTAHEGVLVDLARAAFGKAGYRVDYQLLNWARAVDETRDGQFDGIVGALHTDAPDFVFPQEMQAVSRNCFYTAPKDHWSPAPDLEASLRDRTLGIANAYSYGPLLDGYIESHRRDGRVSVLSGDDLFKRNLDKMRAGHVDTVVEDHWVAAWVLQQSHMTDEVRQAGCLPPTSVYIAFSPAHPERSHRLASLLDETVRQMRLNGELDRLLAGYGIH